MGSLNSCCIDTVIEKDNNRLNPDQTEQKKVNFKGRMFQAFLKPRGDHRKTKRHNPKLKKNKRKLLNFGSTEAQLEKDNSSLNSEQTDQKKDAEVEIQAYENTILNEIDQYTQKENIESER